MSGYMPLKGRRFEDLVHPFWHRVNALPMRRSHSQPMQFKYSMQYIKTSLNPQDFFGDEEMFIAYGHEKVSADDFDINVNDVHFHASTSRSDIYFSRLTGFATSIFPIRSKALI